MQPNATQGKDALFGGYDDTDGNGNYGNNNQFSANKWTAGGSPVSYRSAIAFDMSAIPSNATIMSASISLYAWDATNGLGQHATYDNINACWLERITSPWD